MGLAGETILITGFPGFVAQKIALRLLAEEPAVELVLLRRSADADTSAALLGTLPPAERARVRELDGDPAALDFGLSGAEYRALSREIDRIFHVASTLASRERGSFLANQNIACAREVLELAHAAAGLRGVVLLSSVSVSGARTGTILEEELSAGQAFRSKLEESLATVELMFERQPQIPQLVLRPAQIVGDSVTGEIDRLGFPYPWLVFVDQSPAEMVLPVPQRPDTIVQVVPIDYVTRVAVCLAGRVEAYGRRFHLVDSAPPTLREFLEIAAISAGKRLAPSFNAGALTRGLVAKPTLRLFSQGARSLLELFAASPRYDTRNTEALLDGSGIECPRVASYMTTLLERARAGFAAHEVEPVDLTSEDGGEVS